MAWKITTPAAAEPITTAEAKSHLRIDAEFTDDDVYIASLIKAATQWAELYQGRSFVTRTITLERDRFSNVMELPAPPLITVTSIKYIDSDGTQQTLSADIYDVDTKSEPGRITLAYNQSWPVIRGDVNGIEIIYTAGYGAAGDVPEMVKSAIKLIVGHLYENRETVTAGITAAELPMGAKSLLSIDRVF
jgi:uncharacterized phiE125 gp8 family phage protein